MSPEQLQFYKSAYEDESDVWEDPKGTFRDIKVLIGAVEELAARSTPKQGEDVARLQAECDEITVINHTMWLAVENIRLLAARHRKDEWAQHVLRFCADAGNASNPLRAPSVEPASETIRQLRSVLRVIAEQDPVEMALDPQWAKRIAKGGLDATAASAPPPQQVEPDWVIEYEASQDGCVQYTSPSEIMARAHAEAEGAWAFEIFEVKRRKLAPKEPKP